MKCCAPSIRLIAKMPTLAAISYKNNLGHPYMYPNNKLGYVENFLHMMFGLPTEEYTVDPVVANALNTLLILHADHEQNCSTSTVRMVGSSQSNLYSAVSAGIAALWGPLHGGANQEVIEMLETIRNDGGDIQKWVNKAKDKQRPVPSVRLRPPCLQELRPTCHHHQEELRRRVAEAGCERPGTGHRQTTGGDRLEGRLLH
jgi:citrate synthase